MVIHFNECFSSIVINCIIADALYGTRQFFTGVSKVYKNAQIIGILHFTVDTFKKNRFETKEFVTFFSN